MSDLPQCDVICVGGPFDGKIEAVYWERKEWQVWRPVLIKGGFGSELMGSYVVAPDRIIANWAEADRGTL